MSNSAYGFSHENRPRRTPHIRVLQRDNPETEDDIITHILNYNGYNKATGAQFPTPQKKAFTTNTNQTKMNMQRFFSLLFTLVAMTAYGTERFVSFSRGDVELTGMHGDITFDNNDSKAVKIAVANLKEDLEKVTGRCDYPITIGTIGISKTVKDKDMKNELDGKWEKYVIKVSDKGITIAGSDRRGTVYGIYELSEQLGVSPWYWWADVPVTMRRKVFLKKGAYTDGEPAVKYRGIFINDEWPSFGTWASNKFGGINSKMYARVFELLLRLKANYLWPAMWASAFNEDDPFSPQVADDYGIVMGTSHHEPMMRAHKEYVKRRDSVGPWDYSVNKERLDKFFEEGIRRNKDYDNLITIGMRGDGDVAMGKGDDEENMRVLKDVIESQCAIIKKVYGKKAEEVPMMWAIFTEVQRYYDAGFTVPDDVTLLFCDNNWGYIRRTGPEKERSRKGGMGLYYHIDMNGGPWNDRWVNTTTAAKLREQLNLAYRTGLDRIWIINVGDLKPKEMPIDFIMRYAWNPDAYPADKIEEYMTDWARKIFGGEHAHEIAAIVTEYSRLNLERKPEVQVPGIYSAATGEAQEMLKRWEALERRTLDLSAKIPETHKDAFFQLVEYPAVASAGVAKIYLAATLGDRQMMQDMYKRDKKLTEKYNKELAGGKWDGMMLDKHIGYTKWSMPDENTLPEVCPQIQNLVTPKGEIPFMACDYTRRFDGNEASWYFIPGLGRGRGCMGSDNVCAASNPDGDAALEYDFLLEKINGDTLKLALGILPTNDLNPARGLRLGVTIDGAPMMTVDARQGYVDTFEEYTPANIAKSKMLKPLPPLASDIYLTGVGKMRRNETFDNLRWLSIDLGKAAPGKHTLRISMIDPEIVLEKLIINPDNDAPSYYGSK